MKRVRFTLSEKSREALEELRRQGGFDTLGDALRESLRVHRALMAQARQGYRHVIVRDPGTGDQRRVIIPHIEAAEPEPQAGGQPRPGGVFEAFDGIFAKFDSLFSQVFGKKDGGGAGGS